MLNGDILISTQTVEHDDNIYILLFIYSLMLFPKELWAIQFHTLTLSLIDYLPSFRLPSKSISGLQFWIILGIYFILYSELIHQALLFLKSEVDFNRECSHCCFIVDRNTVMNGYERNKASHDYYLKINVTHFISLWQHCRHWDRKRWFVVLSKWKITRCRLIYNLIVTLHAHPSQLTCVHLFTC